MEEKGEIRVSLSTFFLILAIIVIGIMAYFLYILHNEKETTAKEVNTLNSQAANLENTINTLKEEKNSTTNTDTDSILGADNSEKTEQNKFSITTIKDTFQKYLNLEGSIIGQPDNLLRELGFDFTMEISTVEHYVKTNIKYSDFEKEIQKYMTVDWFSNNFNYNGNDSNPYFKEENGSVSYWNVGSSGMQWEVKEISLESDLTYTAEVYYINEDETKEKIDNAEFSISEYNGKCVISYCSL